MGAGILARVQPQFRPHGVRSGAGAPPPFTPSTVANLVHWQRADAGNLYQDVANTTLANTDNAPVGSWLDLTASGIPWVQAAAGNRPVFRTSVQNGLPMVHFEGTSSQYLSANAIATTYLTGTDRPYSLFAVFRIERPAAGPAPFAAGNSSSDNPFLFQSITASTYPYNWQKRDDALSAVLVDTLPLQADSAAHTLILSHTGTALTTWIDGTLINNAAAADVGLTTLNLWTMGALARTGLTRFLTGFIGEYGLYSRAINSAEAGQIQSYLKGRWNTPNGTQTPPTIPNLVQWVKADAANLWQNLARTQPAINPVDPVAAWDDLTPLLNAFTQGSDAFRPAFVPGVQNGLPMLSFTSAALQVMLSNAVATTYLSGDDRPFSVFAVFRFTDLTGGPTVVGAGSSTNAFPYTFLSTGGPGGNYQFSRRGDIASPTVAVNQGTVDSTTVHTWIVSFAGTTVSVWVDGVQLASGVSADTGVATLDQWAIGTLARTTNSRYLSGYIGELGVYSRAINSAEAVSLQTYLQNRWGTTPAPPDPTAPYGVAGAVLWLKADAQTFQDSALTTPATTDTQPVGGWVDQTGLTHNVLQATAGRRPLFRTAVQNGLPTVRFDGVDDYLQALFALTTTFHIFLVCRQNTWTLNNTPLSGGAGDNFSLMQSAALPNLAVWNGSAISSGVGGLPVGTFGLVQILVAVTNGHLKINAGSNLALGTAGNAGGITVGAHPNPSGYTGLDVGELIVYNVALSDANEAIVRNALNARWNLF